MRVQGLNGAAATATPSAARRLGGGTFRLGEDESTRGTSASAGLRSIASLDALLALQSVEDPTERRKRAVKNGRQALDVLDALKLSVLDGTLDQSVVGRLKSAAEGLKGGGSGDSGLDAVLGEIELRVEVELAKAARN
jgi:hypothetical protein